MEVLSRKEYADIITWTPSGKAFNVINSKEFTARILPTHFKGTKYSSFTRKLCRWGFTRHYRGEEAGAYHHKYFQKDRLELVEKMTCFKEGSKPFAPQKEEKTESLPPRSNPMATKEALANVLPPLPSRFLPSMSRWSANPSIQRSRLMHAPTDFNAAIEMEVSRRLKERVSSAAAMSREALAMMRHQVKPPSSAYTVHRYLASLQQGGVSSPLVGNNLVAAYREIAMKQRFNSTAAHIAATTMSNDQRQWLSNLPSRNIRIAKMA
jgi:hypothetical protein